jgi:hypothetical protein
VDGVQNFPNFSPIEEALSKIEAVLRRTQARSRELLQEAIAKALEMVSRVLSTST